MTGSVSRLALQCLSFFSYLIMNHAKINLRPGEWPWLFISHPKINLVAPLILLHSRTILFLSYSSSDDVGFSQWKHMDTSFLPDHTNPPFSLHCQSSPHHFHLRRLSLLSTRHASQLVSCISHNPPPGSCSILIPNDYASSIFPFRFSSSRSHDPLFICLSMYNCCFVPSCFLPVLSDPIQLTQFRTRPSSETIDFFL